MLPLFSVTALVKSSPEGTSTVHTEALEAVPSIAPRHFSMPPLIPRGYPVHALMRQQSCGRCHLQIL